MLLGMFLVNIMPILGFPVAFLWAWAKMKRTKAKLAGLKLTAITAAFLILNATITLFAYTLTINLMKNTLVKAAYAQSASPEIVNTIPMQDIPGMNSGMLEQLVPGFSGIQGEDSYDPGDYQIPEDIINQETGEDGSPVIETGGDKLYIDTDGDGEYDSYIDGNGNLIPMGDKTQTDAEGNIYIDYDGDGIREVMIDTEGVVHYDLDGNGEYETTYEQSWGQG